MTKKENKDNIKKKVENNETSAEEKKFTKPKKKKIKREISSGIAFVNSTFNNTIVSIADDNGNVISWSSAGSKGFKGSRKSTFMLLKLQLRMLVPKLMSKVKNISSSG